MGLYRQSRGLREANDTHTGALRRSVHLFSDGGRLVAVRRHGGGTNSVHCQSNALAMAPASFMHYVLPLSVCTFTAAADLHTYIRHLFFALIHKHVLVSRNGLIVPTTQTTYYKVIPSAYVLTLRGRLFLTTWFIGSRTGDWLPAHIWHAQEAIFLMTRGTPNMWTTGQTSHPFPPETGGNVLRSMVSLFTTESKIVTIPTDGSL